VSESKQNEKGSREGDVNESKENEKGSREGDVSESKKNEKGSREGGRRAPSHGGFVPSRDFVWDTCLLACLLI